MNRDIFKGEIVSFVQYKRGCKASDIVHNFPANLDYFGNGILDELVLEKDLIEVEYTFPDTPKGYYSFYIPGNAKAYFKIDPNT